MYEIIPNLFYCRVDQFLIIKTSMAVLHVHYFGFDSQIRYEEMLVRIGNGYN